MITSFRAASHVFALLLIATGLLMASGPVASGAAEMNAEMKKYRNYLPEQILARKCEFMGTEFPKLDKPRISKIVDGDKLIEAEREAFSKRKYELLASEYRNEVAAALERAKSASSTHDKGAEGQNSQ
jgi:hypothetical protein